jgi:hypothetical protein
MMVVVTIFKNQTAVRLNRIWRKRNMKSFQAKSKKFSPSKHTQAHTSHQTQQIEVPNPEIALRIVDPELVRKLEISEINAHQLHLHTMKRNKLLITEWEKYKHILDPDAKQKQLLIFNALEAEVRDLHKQVALIKQEVAVFHDKMRGTP